MCEHRNIEIIPGDTVIISASPIPGNEKMINKTIDNLFKQGAEVINESVPGVHVSGHASQEELKLMMNLTKPKFFIPVHGEYRHLIKHAQLAKDVGIPPEILLHRRMPAKPVCQQTGWSYSNSTRSWCPNSFTPDIPIAKARKLGRFSDKPTRRSIPDLFPLKKL